VAFASVDPVWLGMHEWLQSAPWASRNHLTRDCLGGELGAFGHVLHISRLAEIAPTHVLETHQQETSQLLDFATSSEVCDQLTGLAATNEPATTDIIWRTSGRTWFAWRPSRLDFTFVLAARAVRIQDRTLFAVDYVRGVGRTGSSEHPDRWTECLALDGLESATTPRWISTPSRVAHP
jgi:hypothetical protein